MKLDKYLVNEAEETAIPKDALTKLNNSVNIVKEWKSGKASDYEVRNILAFNCCTILRDMIGGSSWKKVLLDLYTKILQHPNWGPE